MRRGIRSGSKLIESLDMAQGALERPATFAFVRPPREKAPSCWRRVGAMSHAIVRLRTSVRTSWAWEYRHRRFMVPVRIGIGIWLVVLTAILYGYGRGGWWGVLLVPAAALHFYLAYRNLRHRIQS